MDISNIKNLKYSQNTFCKINNKGGVKTPIKTNIMRLIDRLKPHYKEILEKENVKFPALVQSVVEDLEQVEHIHLLLYNTVLNMNLVFNTNISPYELFEEY